MTPQQTIAHYRIVSKLGEGGMGAVYRATDTKLNRDVAIKVLPAAFAEDADRMARFTREAQVLASLNHPNIAAIYGVEQAAIVMELVEGKDLAGPLPIDTAIDYARQIATGLEAAHEKGIVHRDLKPANIKVTPDGIVKLLDFGLAKAPAQSESGATLTISMTQAGMIVGTAAYMSPEQARGKPVDRRADIWAFGVVLFELLTGTSLFGGGETLSDCLAAVITREPDWAALPKDTPPHLRRLLERCLRKDPKLRLQAIGDARIALDEPDSEVPAPATTVRRAWLPWAIAGVAIIAAAVVAGITWFRPGVVEPGPGAVHFEIPFPAGGTVPKSGAAAQWVPSPDGRNIAMLVADSSGIASIWVRPLAGSTAHRLDKTEGADLPFWSPDGKSIGFFTEKQLKRIDVSGGIIQALCDIALAPEGFNRGDGGTWNADGVIVFAQRQQPLMRVSAAGGTPAPVTTLEAGERSHSWPQFLPDGRHFLYMASGAAPSDHTIYVQELGSTSRIPVLKNPTRAVWAPPGYLVFGREGSIFVQRVNARTFHLEGEALPLLADDVVSNTGNGRSTVAVSENGVLVYRTGRRVGLKQITWRDRAGKVLNSVGPRGQYLGITLSPDEKSLAVLAGDSGRVDISILDLASGVITPMTHDGQPDTLGPAWSPDSKRLAISLRGGGIDVIDVASGKASPSPNRSINAEDWLTDGRSILCRDFGGALYLFTPGETNLRPIPQSPRRQVGDRISPDGELVTYGASDVYVATFPSFSVIRKISINGGTYSVWGKGGKVVYYRSDDGWLMEVEIRKGATLEAGVPKPLFKFGVGATGNRFAVNSDGTRFLINEFVEVDQIEKPELNVIVNWAAELKRP